MTGSIFSNQVAEWKEDEDALISAHLYDKPFPAPEISRKLGRTVHSVKARAQRLRARRRELGLAPPLNRPVSIAAFHKNPKAGANGGELKCLNCRAVFNSWDTKKNRLCPRCANKAEDITHTRHSYKKGFV